MAFFAVGRYSKFAFVHENKVSFEVIMHRERIIYGFMNFREIIWITVTAFCKKGQFCWLHFRFSMLLSTVLWEAMMPEIMIFVEKNLIFGAHPGHDPVELNSSWCLFSFIYSMNKSRKWSAQMSQCTVVSLYPSHLFWLFWGKKRRHGWIWQVYFENLYSNEVIVAMCSESSCRGWHLRNDVLSPNVCFSFLWLKHCQELPVLTW